MADKNDTAERVVHLVGEMVRNKKSYLMKDESGRGGEREVKTDKKSDI